MLTRERLERRDRSPYLMRRRTFRPRCDRMCDSIGAGLCRPYHAVMEPTETPTATLDAATIPAAEDLLVEDEVLVEEISIDGMCGVY